jgi:LysM repeat protein
MRTKVGGTERYLLTAALLIPVAISLFLAAQLAGVNVRFGFPTAYASADATSIVTRRPAASGPMPPPTLAPAPTPTPAPAAVAQPTPVKEQTYTVQKGDELKNIAAAYGVNIFKLIEANDIPDPDSLRIGQVLRIPS